MRDRPEIDNLPQSLEQPAIMPASTSWRRRNRRVFSSMGMTLVSAGTLLGPYRIESQAGRRGHGRGLSRA